MRVPPTAATVPVGRAAGAPPPRRRSWLLPAVLALLLLGGGGALAAVIASDGDDRRTATRIVTQHETVTTPGAVRVRTEVQTVTTQIEEEPPPPPPPPPPGPSPGPPPANVGTPSVSEGIRLTDQNKYANDRGDYAAGLRYGEQAVAALQGSGIRYEAYAYYNYGVSLLRTGRCDEALDYFDRSEEIQGHRDEIVRARAEAERCARGRSSEASEDNEG